MIGNMYTLDIATRQTSSTAVFARLRLWHERLGHVDPTGIKAMTNTGTVNGISLKESENEAINCNERIIGKGRLRRANLGPGTLSISSTHTSTARSRFNPSEGQGT